MRQAPPSIRGQGALATLLLSGTESVALDLKQESPRTVLHRFLAEADVLVESFRPGTMQRLGLDLGDLARRYPRLVICSLSGWGQSGPRSARAGHDLTYQAVAGSLAPTGAMPSVPVADTVGAWSAVTAILAALFERQSTGRGARVDAALLDSAVHANLAAWASEGGARMQVGERLPLTGSLPCYNLYSTRDGHLLALAILEKGLWKSLCEAVEREDLVALHYRQDEESRSRVAELVEGRTAKQWQRLIDELDLPAEMVLSAEQARLDPQVQARDVLRRGEDGLLRLAFPALFDGRRPAADERFPGLGEDTAEVLEEWRLDAAGLPARKQRAAGIGRRFSLRRILWRRFSR